MNFLDEIVMALEAARLDNPELEFFFYIEEDGSSRILGKDRFGDITSSTIFQNTDEAIEKIRLQLEEAQL